ncbi:MAG TPA: M14 family zinc carboxypeptidase [Bacteroidales bacterium]|nr:M14 family zinc carboxypeptidase [Bacteroidales bacterium]
MLKKACFLLLLLTANICFAQQHEKLSLVKIFGNFKEITAAGISIEHGHFNKSFFEGEINASDVEILKSSGLNYEIITEDITKFYLERLQQNVKPDNKNITYSCSPATTYSTPAHFGPGSMGGFYTYSEAIAQLDSMRVWFPNLISAKTQIGSSIESRAIYAVKISDNPDASESEKQVLFTSLHHSSEPCGLQQLIFFMYYLLENYNTNSEVKYLIDNLEIYFVPVVNPDGYVYNETQNSAGGGTWRKNRRYNDILSYGVDLNRNYGYAWGYDDIGSQPLGISPWYRGTEAFSEPESQTMKSFIEAHDFLLDMNWHSWGNFLIYPWNYHSSMTPDSTYFEQLSRYVTMESHYRYGTCQQTYGYNSNGDADDWGYGDTTAKNKVFSITAEVGASSDGFWPAPANIEALCENSLDMNLRFARLGTKYALVNDLSSSFISGTSVTIPVEVYCLGLDVPADFTVSITPLSPDITGTGSSASFAGMQTLERRYDNVSFTLDPSIAQGTPVTFSLDISNGIYTWKDTITKIFCTPDTLLYDPADNLNNWTASGWAVSTESYASAPSCFTESPSSNYGLLQTSTLELTNSLDLSTAVNAYLSFKAKWEIEKSFDWVQVLASADNGSTWQPLCGNYSSYGTDDQKLSEPVYDGYFLNWLPEEISLDAYLGGTIKIKFEFHSDQTNNYDGFYLDDIAVLSNSVTTASVGEIQPADQINAYPNPACDKLTVNYNASERIPDRVVIADIYGKQVYNEAFNAKVGNLIYVSDLANGTYILQFKDSDSIVAMKKIIVMH